MDAAQIELLGRSKRRAVLVLCLTAVALLVVSAWRFVPRLNDALSGKAEYVRILTETFGRQLATQTQMQFPVIVEQDEHGTCQAVSAPSIAEEEIRGTIYLLTYSEQQNLTCAFRVANCAFAATTSCSLVRRFLADLRRVPAQRAPRVAGRSCRLDRFAKRSGQAPPVCDV